MSAELRKHTEGQLAWNPLSQGRSGAQSSRAGPTGQSGLGKTLAFMGSENGPLEGVGQRRNKI